MQADVEQGGAAGAFLGDETGVGGGHRFKDGFLDGESGYMRGGDHGLMFLERCGNDVDVGFEARTDAFLGLAVAGAAIEREVLRQDVEQHAIALQADVGGELHGVGEILDIHFARASEFVEAAAVAAADAHAADADGDAFDRYLRPALGIEHGGANGFGESHLIADAAFGPAGGRRETMRKITDVIAIEGANDAAGARAAGVEANGELRLLKHYSTTVMDRKSVKSRVAAPGRRRLISE